ILLDGSRVVRLMRSVEIIFKVSVPLEHHSTQRHVFIRTCIEVKGKGRSDRSSGRSGSLWRSHLLFGTAAGNGYGRDGGTVPTGHHVQVKLAVLHFDVGKSQDRLLVVALHENIKRTLHQLAFKADVKNTSPLGSGRTALAPVLLVVVSLYRVHPVWNRDGIAQRMRVPFGLVQLVLAGSRVVRPMRSVEIIFKVSVPLEHHSTQRHVFIRTCIEVKGKGRSDRSSGSSGSLWRSHLLFGTAAGNGYGRDGGTVPTGHHVQVKLAVLHFDVGKSQDRLLVVALHENIKRTLHQLAFKADVKNTSALGSGRTALAPVLLVVVSLYRVHPVWNRDGIA